MNAGNTQMKLMANSTCPFCSLSADVDIVCETQTCVAFYDKYPRFPWALITFKKQSTFEIMALNLIELKCLGQTDVAVNEFCKYAVCDIQTAAQVVDLL